MEKGRDSKARGGAAQPSPSGKSPPGRTIERGDVETDGTQMRQQDWDEIGDAAVIPEEVAENGDFRYAVEKDGDLPEEDDDNPDQASDEALPDDDEETAIRRDMSGQGVRYKPE